VEILVQWIPAFAGTTRVEAAFRAVHISCSWYSLP
jgi:hypothetical protein